MKTTRRLDDVREEAAQCKACDLWRVGTQTVFGEGRARASVMFVGEQPGDREDLAGRPFVGPAGRLLDTALERAGIVRSDVYVTNAVKHFNWTARGKRRIHKRPEVRHIEACHGWLEMELELVQPQVVVALGAVALRALAGTKVQLTKTRGTVLEGPHGAALVPTIHPSSIWRGPEDRRQAAMDSLVADLCVVRDLVA